MALRGDEIETLVVTAVEALDASTYDQPGRTAGWRSTPMLDVEEALEGGWVQHLSFDCVAGGTVPSADQRIRMEPDEIECLTDLDVVFAYAFRSPKDERDDRRLASRAAHDVLAALVNVRRGGTSEHFAVRDFEVTAVEFDRVRRLLFYRVTCTVEHELVLQIPAAP